MIQVKFKAYGILMQEWRLKEWYSDIQMQKWQKGVLDLHMEVKRLKKEWK